jgi:fatty acid desaturase
MRTAEAPLRSGVPEEASAPRGSDFAQLSRDIKQLGLLDRRTGYYIWKVGATVALWAAGGVAFFLLGDSWWQLAVAAYFAIVFTQLGFLGHDAGHQQIFGTRSANYALGVLLANVSIGLSYDWWVGKHTRHHAHPNDEDKDPDVGAGALVFTIGQAIRSRGVARRLYRYQAYLFFPLLLLEGLNLRVASIRYLIQEASRHRTREALLLGIHIATYLTLVFLVLSPAKAVVFIAVHQGLFGLYLGCSFAPNHKGMPTLTAAEEADFLRRQVLTSRNVRGQWFIDGALGGLNYQIEHHLFPSMPRPNLRHAQRTVRTFCEEHRVSYRETGLIASYAQGIRHLHAVGRAALPAPAA